MHHLEVRDLNKKFGSLHAVEGVSFSVEQGRLVGLLGPSGGGKTTLLRMLAGLERPDGGSIAIGGRNVDGLPPQDRGIGFVFQNYALFKHMTVVENIAFGLKVKKWERARIYSRVAELLALTGLTGLERRYPHQLSGGQRQRVAFARALAPEPHLLLLDEPFAAIDAKVRKELRTWLKEMIARVGVTSLFVTHDQEEAVEVADDILIMSQGRLEQKGTPWEIYRAPKTPFVATFIGESAALNDLTALAPFAEATVSIAGKASLEGLDDLQALVRPESIEISRAHEHQQSSAALPGVVSHVQFRGDAWHVEVQVGAQRLIARRPLAYEPLTLGEEVSVLVHRLYLFAGQKSWIVENPFLLQREKERIV